MINQYSYIWYNGLDTKLTETLVILHLHPHTYPADSPLTCLYLCYPRDAAVALVSHSYHSHIICSTAEQRGKGAVSLVGAAGGCVVSRLDNGIETLSAQSLIPGQDGNASDTRVCVLHVCRGTRRWGERGLQFRKHLTIPNLNLKPNPQVKDRWGSKRFVL